MMLRDATSSEIDAILGQTHALWSDGLDLSSYRDYIHTMMASAWAAQGARNYRFLVLVDSQGGEPLCAMKLYRFNVRLDDETIPAGGVGAVFTPHALRRRGLAAEMIRRAHAIMAERGDLVSLLFSEIGAAYYAKLGYRGMSLNAARLAVPPAGPAGATGTAGAVRLRRMHRNDLDVAIRLREKEDAPAAFAIVRDRDYWKYLLARASYPTLSLARENWESRLMLACDQSYLWSLFGHTHEGSAAKLFEFAEAEPGTVLVTLLDDFFEECRRRRAAVADTWLPPASAARDPRLAPPGGARLEPPPIVPMWFPLDPQAGADMQRHADDARLHLTDLF
jgi:GNAT acetyltransferase-like protein